MKTLVLILSLFISTLSLVAEDTLYVPTLAGSKEPAAEAHYVIPYIKMIGSSEKGPLQVLAEKFGQENSPYGKSSPAEMKWSKEKGVWYDAAHPNNPLHFVMPGWRSIQYVDPQNEASVFTRLNPAKAKQVADAMKKQ